LENLKRRDRFEDIGENVRVILKWIIKNGVRRWVAVVWLRIGSSRAPFGTR
jgi:hypothetical protein